MLPALLMSSWIYQTKRQALFPVRRVIFYTMILKRGLAAVVGSARPPLVGLSGNARTAAETITANWQGADVSGGNTKNFIGGQFVGK
jgi:malonate-semialdehyde dehydrogenase (acetylating) / methylmalonate-semialdehyde dehydrogenase